MGVQTAARDRSWGGNVGGLWSSTWHPDDKLVFFFKKFQNCAQSGIPVSFRLWGPPALFKINDSLQPS